MTWFLAVSGVWGIGLPAITRADSGTASVPWSEAFAELDRDADNRITRPEYVTGGGRPAERLRDFVMFDFDADQSLDKLEFAAAFTIDSSRREPIPDPWDAVATMAMEAIDESYDGWQQRPDEQVPLRGFVTNYLQSISIGQSPAVTGRLLLQADPNEDGSVSRQEAFDFFRQQLGLRVGGALLRQADGRVAEFFRFVQCDRDRDNLLSEGEFSVYGWAVGSVETRFREMDRDGNGVITVEEFVDPEGRCLIDPIGWFRKADADLDARLDRAELRAATVGRRRYLIDPSLRAFDEDGDEKLSLQEYRLSIHAAVNYPWFEIPKDDDGDGQLSYREFRFDATDRFELQRRFFFHRNDRDGDGQLTPPEFPFRRPGEQALMMVSVDGTATRSLYRIRSGLLDSPDVSPDGQSVLLHHSRSDDLDRAMVIRLDIESGRLTQLCDGTHPSWSPDGDRFVCSRSDGGQGIWIMDGDGQAGRRIGEGFSPRWSPDGTKIAYVQEQSLWIHDVASGESEALVTREDHSYRHLWWNMAWSPDSRRLVLCGVSAGTSDVLIANLDTPGQLRVRESSSVELGRAFAWSPDGRRVLFPMRNRRERRTQWFELDPDDDGPPRPVDAVDGIGEAKAGCFTPDGTCLISLLES
jgi:hypothetical protein